MKPRVFVIGINLDNTPYDWLGFWHTCFSAMPEEFAGTESPDTASDVAASVIPASGGSTMSQLRRK